MAVGVVHIAAVRVGQLELHPGQRFLRHGVQLADYQGTLGLIIEAQSLHLARFDLNGLGSAVQDIALQSLDLPGGDGGAGLQAINHDAAILVGDVLAVAGANHCTGAVRDQEGDPLQGRGGALDVLLNHQCSAGGVGEVNCLRVVGVHLDGLGLLGRVDGISGDGRRLGDHQGAHHTVNLDLAALVRLVDAVAGDVAVFVRHILAGTGRHFERDPLQGFARQRIPLVDDEGPRPGVGQHHRLGVAIGANDHIGGGGVHHIAVRGLDLREHIGAGGQIGDADFACGIGGKDAVLGQRGIPDYSVQPHLAAGGGRDSELRAGKRLAGGTVPLLDNQFTFRLILKSEADRPALFDLHGLGLGIHNVARRGLGFCHHHALAGLEAGDQDFSVLIRPEDPVAVPDNSSVGIGDLELGVRQGYAGVDRAYLADEQIAVRHVLEADGNDALLPVVRQIDSLGGLDDAVSVRGVYLFNHICPRPQARPEGHAVGAGGPLPDDGTAGAGGTAQVAELEPGPAQGFAGDAVVFLNYDGIERHVLEGHRPVPAAGDVELLGGGFLDGEAGGGLQLRHPVPAVSQALQHDLAVGVGEVGAQIVELTGVGVVAAVPHLKLGPLDGVAGDAVHLLDGQGGLFVILKINRSVPVGIESDQLAGGVQQIGGGHGFLRDLINTRQEILQGCRSVCPCLNFIHAVAVRRLHQEHGIRHGLPGVRVPLHHRQVGPDVVLQNDGGGSARKQLHMALHRVDDVV